jgi:hypothetical protein
MNPQATDPLMAHPVVGDRPARGPGWWVAWVLVAALVVGGVVLNVQMGRTMPRALGNR